MSSSVPCNVPYVLNLLAKNIFSKMDISQIDIQKLVEGEPMPLPDFKILDVGCGFGKWGFLIRDTFEVMAGQNFNKKDWKIQITGVEPFDKCITTIQRELYTKIIQKDIFDVLQKIGKYDLIIMGDVIEHFDKEKAYKLLDLLFEHSENIIISTPLGFMPQGAWAGNEREIHKSGWKLEDFKKYNIIEHRILQDDLFLEMMKQIPNLPDEMKNGLSLIVLWLKR